MPTTSPLRVVILISGNGSNLQAIIDFFQASSSVNIVAVFSNIPEAYGLLRAKQAGIPTQTINHKDYASREAFDQALQNNIAVYRPDLVVLAGFMRILSANFVQEFSGKMLNIHPSLLPEFRGLHTHQRAIDAGKKEHGVSVHFVSEALDGGPVILQARVPIKKNDTPDTLSARVQIEEHRIYPLVIQWVAEKRLMLKENKVFMNNTGLSQPLDASTL